MAQPRGSVTNKGQPVRFHLPNGEKVTLSCAPDDTFEHIKDMIWNKKHFKDNSKSNFVFRMMRGEVFFTEHEKFEKLLDLEPIFRESAENNFIEMMMIPVADVGDRVRRQAKRPSDEGPHLIHGPLYKRGGSAGSIFKKRYFVLESVTLYYFDNVKTFFNKGQATDFIPMGSCQAVPVVDKSRPFCFELKAEHLGKRNFTLSAETGEDMTKWLKAIYALNLRRVKSICYYCIEDLVRRGLADMDGIFRLSGSQEAVHSIKGAFDYAEYPVLPEFRDDNAVAGVMKLALRELSEPLLTFNLYKDFIAAGDIKNPQERVHRLGVLISQLPVSNRGFLRYLLRFIAQVATYADKNRMTTKNLAIVFGPNLLRPAEESLSSVTDTANNLTVMQALIEHVDDIWAEEMKAEEEEDAGASSDEESPAPPVHRNSFPPAPIQTFGIKNLSSQSIPENMALSPVPASPRGPRAVGGDEDVDVPLPQSNSAMMDELKKIHSRDNSRTSVSTFTTDDVNDAELRVIRKGFLNQTARYASDITARAQTVNDAWESFVQELATKQVNCPRTVATMLESLTNDLTQTQLRATLALDKMIAVFKSTLATLDKSTGQAGPVSAGTPKLPSKRTGQAGGVSVFPVGPAQPPAIDHGVVSPRHDPPPLSPRPKLSSAVPPTSMSPPPQPQSKPPPPAGPHPPTAAGAPHPPPAAAAPSPAAAPAAAPAMAVSVLPRMPPTLPKLNPVGSESPSTSTKSYAGRGSSAAPQPPAMMGELASKLNRRRQWEDGKGPPPEGMSPSTSNSSLPSSGSSTALAPSASAPATRAPGGSMDKSASSSALAAPVGAVPPVKEEAEAEADDVVGDLPPPSFDEHLRARNESGSLPPPPPTDPRISVPPPPPKMSVSEAPPPPRRVTAVAQFEYEGGHRDDEVTFKEGAEIEIIDNSDKDGWWEGSVNGKRGWFPGNYVQLQQ